MAKLVIYNDDGTMVSEFGNIEPGDLDIKNSWNDIEAIKGALKRAIEGFK